MALLILFQIVFAFQCSLAVSSFVLDQAIAPVQEFTTVALSQLIKLIKDQLQAIINIIDLFAFADQLAWECPQRAILSLNYLLNIIDLNRNSIMDIIHLKVFQRLKYDVDAMVSKAAFGLTPIVKQFVH